MKLFKYLLAAAILFAPLQPAFAHDTVTDTYPKAETTVEESIDSVRILFSDNTIAGEGNTVNVIGSNGNYYQTGCVQVNGNTMTAPVLMGGSGTYKVEWTQNSSDGHKNSGSFTFDYKPKGGVQAAGFATPPACDEVASKRLVESRKSVEAAVASESKAATTKKETAAASSGGSAWLWLWILLPVVVIIAITAYFIVRRRNSIGSNNYQEKEAEMDLGDIAGKAKEAAEKVADGAKEAVEKVAEGAKDAAEKAADAAKKLINPDDQK